MSRTRMELQWDDIDLGDLVQLDLCSRTGERGKLIGRFCGLRHGKWMGTGKAPRVQSYAVVNTGGETEVWEPVGHVVRRRILKKVRRDDGDD